MGLRCNFFLLPSLKRRHYNAKYLVSPSLCRSVSQLLALTFSCSPFLSRVPKPANVSFATEIKRQVSLSLSFNTLFFYSGRNATIWSLTVCNRKTCFLIFSLLIPPTILNEHQNESQQHHHQSIRKCTKWNREWNDIKWVTKKNTENRHKKGNRTNWQFYFYWLSNKIYFGYFFIYPRNTRKTIMKMNTLTHTHAYAYQTQRPRQWARWKHGIKWKMRIKHTLILRLSIARLVFL